MNDQRAVVLNLNDEQLAYWRKTLGLGEQEKVTSSALKEWLYAHSDMPKDKPRGFPTRKAKQ